MNRTIKFRGKRVDNGEWVYGYYLVTAVKHIIYSRDDIQSYFVIPETVGQFTGLLDKDGKEIYEGDYIAVSEGVCVGHDGNGSEIFEWIKGEIYFEDAMFVFDAGYFDPIPICAYENILVIKGNIHDNPELLEEKA